MSDWIRSNLTARKDHVCTMCGRRIARGETYMRGVGLDGTAWSWKECAHCESLFQYVTDLWGDDEYSTDTVGEWGPESMAELRAKVHWTKRWRRADGSLFPIPALRTTRTDGSKSNG